MDTNMRVAVIITDGVDTIIGKSPQNLHKSGHCCDLFKGHVQDNECLTTAALREVKEESNIGLSLKDISTITGPFNYINGDRIIFFVCVLDTLPDINSLKCNSYFEVNGKKYPEIAKYFKVKLKDLPNNLYKTLSKVVVDNNILDDVTLHK